MSQGKKTKAKQQEVQQAQKNNNNNKNKPQEQGKQQNTEEENYRNALRQFRRRRRVKLCFAFLLILVLTLPIASFFLVKEGIKYADANDVTQIQVAGYPIGRILNDRVLDPFVYNKPATNTPFQLQGSCHNLTNAPFDLVIILENIDSVPDVLYRSRMLTSFVSNLLLSLPPISPSTFNVAIIEFATSSAIIHPINSSLSTSQLISRLPSLIRGQDGARSIHVPLSQAYTMLKGHRLDNGNKLVLMVGEGNPVHRPLQDYTSFISKEVMSAEDKLAMMTIPRKMMTDWVSRLNWLGVGMRYVNLGRTYNPDDDTLRGLVGDHWADKVVNAKGALECRWYGSHERELVEMTAEMVCAAGMEKELKRRTGGGTCLNEESRKWY